VSATAETETHRDGLVLGMPDEEYHGGQELSHTGMKHLERSPKHYREYLAHRVEKPAFDFGTAVHAKVLGVGTDIVQIPEDMLASNGAASTKAAKEFIEQARADGLVPLKRDVVERVTNTANAVLANPKAASLFALSGDSEVSGFTTDPGCGVRLRIRVDRLATTRSGRLLPIDLKTTTDVRRHKLRYVIEDLAYDIQAATYRHVLELLTGEEPAPMQLVFVESEPPHEVRVVQLAHHDWIDGGNAKMRRAIETYARCLRTGTWPGDDDAPGEIEAIIPRPFYLADIEAEEAA
jgi:hypothetical protein